MDNLTAMGVFTKVVETGGFSAAARVLGLSKSAVSKHVARLEDRLGARLLNRTTRRLSPTEVGLAFHERCVRILAEIEEAEQAVSRLQAEPRGRLRVAAPMAFGIRHLSPALCGFMARYPDLSVELSLNDRVVDVVDEGFDVAVRIMRLPDSSLIARKVASARRLVCASPAYWAEHSRPGHPRDLQDHACLLYSYLTTGNEWRFERPDEAVSIKVSGRLEANNGDVLRDAAEAGIGVLASPSFIVGESVAAGRLVPVLDDWTGDEMPIYAVYPPGRHLSAKVRVFVDFLVERFGGETWGVNS